MARNEIYKVEIEHSKWYNEKYNYYILARNAREAGRIVLNMKGSRFPKYGWWIRSVTFVCQVNNLNGKA